VLILDTTSYIIKATENPIRLFVKYLTYPCWWQCHVLVGGGLVW